MATHMDAGTNTHVDRQHAGVLLISHLEWFVRLDKNRLPSKVVSLSMKRCQTGK